MGIRKPRLSVMETKRLAFEKTDDPRATPPHDFNQSNIPAGPAEPQSLQQDRPATPIEPVASRPSQFERVAIRPPFDATVDALSPVAAPEKLQVFLSALPPAPGVSNIFDTLCRQYSPAKSLQMILRRAISDYEFLLLEGTFREAPTSYPVVKTNNPLFVYTSRMMPAALIAIARTHFDPLKLESNRALGLKLATAALACFFVDEPRD
ncbi:VirC2 protein [Phyllobacterium myrsinacearum]|uniref:VirC2 family conjugal transfer protein n=1 Tax=Phyllobacterium myrsinacearum TaxID=28101 RepID=UPI001029A72E|nr:VirC2 family conjugal transfer protein [Phyllobacterium myrsinacearum]RZS76852.1 VirC2 protein [Phyllobacterium myrsinacearum]